MKNKISNPRLIESGHFYQKHGVTELSLQSIEIMRRMQKGNDKSILFVDDYHNLGDMLAMERKLPALDLDIAKYEDQFDFCVLETKMVDYLNVVMNKIEKKFRLHEFGDTKSLFGNKLISNGQPTCLMLDLCLVHQKMSLSFVHHVNILPYFYKDEQKALKLIASEIFPKVEIFVILFGPNGSPLSYL